MFFHWKQQMTNESTIDRHCRIFLSAYFLIDQEGYRDVPSISTVEAGREFVLRLHNLLPEGRPAVVSVERYCSSNDYQPQTILNQVHLDGLSQYVAKELILQTQPVNPKYKGAYEFYRTKIHQPENELCSTFGFFIITPQYQDARQAGGSELYREFWSSMNS
jgi:hypothetical protein